MMNHRTPQHRVTEFNEQFALDAPIEARLLDLASESGELAKEFLKSTSYGQKPFHAAPEWQQEMGDVYYALLCIAEKSEIDLDAALDEAMDRYAARVREHDDPSNPAG
jgi:NTP pyrophosphatase (non-canonical NTP hydrolase)